MATPTFKFTVEQAETSNNEEFKVSWKASSVVVGNAAFTIYTDKDAKSRLFSRRLPVTTAKSGSFVVPYSYKDLPVGYIVRVEGSVNQTTSIEIVKDSAKTQKAVAKRAKQAIRATGTGTGTDTSEEPKTISLVLMVVFALVAVCLVWMYLSFSSTNSVIKGTSISLKATK
jgi:hypothetical protein